MQQFKAVTAFLGQDMAVSACEDDRQSGLASPDFETQLDAVRPTETVIIDGLDTSWVTVMRGSNYVRRDIPDAWFQRDYLPRFRPD